MKKLLVILFLFSLAITGQISSSQVGYFKADTIHRRTNVVKAFIDATNVLRANPDMEYTDIYPYDYIRVYANDIFKTKSYVKDSIYNIYVAKDLSLIFTTTPNQYTIIFEDGQSFTAQATGQLLLGMWANHNLRLYIDEINGKDYIIKIEIL